MLFDVMMFLASRFLLPLTSFSLLQLPRQSAPSLALVKRVAKAEVSIECFCLN